jgi:hypothetical protein
MKSEKVRIRAVLARVFDAPFVVVLGGYLSRYFSVKI